MAHMNKVFLLGGLTRDPELKDLGQGHKVCDLSLATSEKWKDKEGQQKEATTYVDIVVWNRQAELCAEYLCKGRQILVEGKLQLDEWETKEGEKRSKLRVRAINIQFMPQSDRNTEQGNHTRPAPQTPPARQNGANTAGDDDLSDFDNDNPF